MTTKCWQWHWTLLLTCLLCFGCGGGPELEKFPVHGKVTYKGEPVQEGNVSFRNETHGGGATIAPTGAFEVQGGLPAGTYLVYITPPDIMEPPTFGKEGKASPKPKEFPSIPKKYRLPATSGFEVTVSASTGDVELKME